MTKYLFESTCTMKDRDRKKWWIDCDCIERKTIKADNIKQALLEYRDIVNKDYCITISNNALKNKKPMYIDDPSGAPKQCGYVLTGSTLFETMGKWIEKYIDIWVNISIISDVGFSKE